MSNSLSRGVVRRPRRLGVALLVASLLALGGLAGSTGAATAAPAQSGVQSAMQSGAGIPGAYVVTVRNGAEPRGVAAR